MKQLNTTLGYPTQNGKYLMMHRVKKKDDINQDKWIGIGGKLEPEETLLACMQRETREETGLVWHDPVLRGIVTFNYAKPGKEAISEQMFLYAGGTLEGDIHECQEGELAWIDEASIFSLELWPGDRIFFELLFMNAPFFYLRLDYQQDELVSASLNNHPLPLQTLLETGHMDRNTLQTCLQPNLAG